jgi:hypothetical protein
MFNKIKQEYTSKHTSINKNKLPASTKKNDWNLYRNKIIIDYGGGKYNNLRDYLKQNYNITLYIYDPYNRTQEENTITLKQVQNALRINFYISIYEGNKSNIGQATKKDCYQRNEKTKEYLRFFKFATITKNMIVKNNQK